jgi:hypothetical protein
MVKWISVTVGVCATTALLLALHPLIWRPPGTGRACSAPRPPWPRSPRGGIGTGNVSVGARGELRDWEIANRADKGTWLPFTFFAIRARPRDGEAMSRVLEARIGPPHEGDSGHHTRPRALRRRQDPRVA